MQIQYYIKQVYGRDTAYIANPDKAAAIYSITGQKSLTAQARRGLEQLGFVFDQILFS